MILSAIFLISSLGLYFSITSSIIETKNEYQYVKGYYASLAGLRLAYIWLQNPSAYPISNSSSYNTTIRTYDSTLASNLGISAPHDVTITVDKDGAQYDVNATYNY